MAGWYWFVCVQTGFFFRFSLSWPTQGCGRVTKVIVIILIKMSLHENDNSSAVTCSSHTATPCFRFSSTLKNMLCFAFVGESILYLLKCFVLFVGESILYLLCFAFVGESILYLLCFVFVGESILYLLYFVFFVESILY